MDLETATDERLLAVRSADLAGPAFACFYRRYERPVLAFHLRRTRDPETAADLTAETFVQALGSRERFVSPEVRRAKTTAAPEFTAAPATEGTQVEGGAAAAWLFGIARHVHARHLRRSAAEARRHALVAVTEARLTAGQHAEIEALLELGPFTAALAALPAHQREAVQAYVLDDRSYDDIATAFAVEPATVRKRVSRGLAALRAATKEAQ